MMALTIDRSIWTGRDDSAEDGDVRRLFQIVKIGEHGLPQRAAALIGFASDAGVERNKGRIGAAQGPVAIKKKMAGLPAHHFNEIWDCGDVICQDGDLESAQLALGAKVAAVMAQGVQPVVLGGGHEIAWGTYLGLKTWVMQQQPQQPLRRLLVLNLDAHFDLRTSRPANSGTPFDQIAQDCATDQRPLQYACWGVSKLANTPALYARAASLQTDIIEDTKLQSMGEGALIARLDRLLAEADDVYLTIDLDVLPASVAPGVSAPAAYGVPLSVIETIALHVKSSGKMRVADIAELNPRLDRDDQTARVAARLAWLLMDNCRSQIN